MKTKFFALLAAVLCLTACEKNNENTVSHKRDITYTIAPAASAIDNATTTTIHLETEAEWQALLDRFCDWAEGGSEVTFYNANRSTKDVATKDVTRFSTTSRTEMKRWMAQMEDEGKTVTVTYDSNTNTYNGIAYATAPHPQQNWVDLGLPSGLLWAKCNVGATTPEDYGNYYAWGETQTKSEYSWYTYKHGIGYNYLTKYCNATNFGYNGFTDTLTILESGDDAATTTLDSNAHIPTESEWDELIQYCSGEWTTLNAVYGYRFTGPNGNSIFLPAAGQHDSSGSTVIGDGEWGEYWSANLNTQYPCTAIDFHFTLYNGETMAGMRYDERPHGLTVRAVHPAQ
jgi:uncharacterized protein (TIGR02145 family)